MSSRPTALGKVSRLWFLSFTYISWYLYTHQSIRPPFLIYAVIHSCFFFHVVNFFPSFLSSFFLSFFIQIWLISISSSSCLFPRLLLFILAFNVPSFLPLCYSFPSFIPSLFLFCILSHLLEPAPQSVVPMVTKKQLTSGGSMVPMSITVRVLYTVERITQLFTSRNRR